MGVGASKPFLSIQSLIADLKSASLNDIIGLGGSALPARLKGLGTIF